jgi:2-iminoacetate synthase
MTDTSQVTWLNAASIDGVLKNARPADKARVSEILAKARELKGLNLEEVAALSAVEAPELMAEVFEAARFIKDRIYGRRVVLFAPLYFSNECGNECTYCAFRRSNTELTRRTLTLDEIREETIALIKQGQKRVLLIAGEDSSPAGFQYLLDAIRTVYSVKLGHGEVRRINVNVAPLSINQFHELEQSGIGTYQLFQETYHRATYNSVHVAGRKANFDWRASALDRAMTAGIGDIGMGVLLGLYDWRFDVMAMLQHISHLEERFGVGCHTISVPRIEPAVGSQMSLHPPYAISDGDFRKIVAILRLAVPYTGMIMSTRETPEMRRETLSLGISQVSGGSCTNPGGYTVAADEGASQFSRGDHRSLDEVIRGVAEAGYIPSFCTACDRLGRTGEHFMGLAKEGKIGEKCGPNALSSFKEYLIDYASSGTCDMGERAIQAELKAMPTELQKLSLVMIGKVKDGARDLSR